MMFFKCYKKLIHRIFLIFCINVHWHEGLILTPVILKFLGQKVVRNGPRAKSWEINAWNFLIFFIDKQQYKDLNLTVMSQIPKIFKSFITNWCIELPSFLVWGMKLKQHQGWKLIEHILTRFLLWGMWGRKVLSLLDLICSAINFLLLR